MATTTKYFEGDMKYMSSLIEDNDIWSINHMTDENLDHSILEQFMIFIIEYKVEQVNLVDFLSSLRIDDCQKVYLSKIPASERLLEKHRQRLICDANIKGVSRYMKLKARVVDRLENLVSTGQIYKISDSCYSVFGPDHITQESKRQIMQSIMDLIGIWWEGFPAPEDAEYIELTDKGKALLENNSLDDIVQILAHEIIHGQADETKIN